MAFKFFLWIFFFLANVLLSARVILSWTPWLHHHAAAARVIQIVDPLLAIIQRFVPAIQGIDFSPLVAFLLLGFLEWSFHKILR